MSDAIRGLKPELVWKYFAEISRIPRGSKNEKAVSEYVMVTARRLGLSARQDKYGNVVVRKSAAPGYSRLKSVALQGHLDMVCEKNAVTVHDFRKDPIELVRNGNIMTANGTTLGADNGIAVATNLAIMEDKTIEHGDLEFLFTVDEETGLTGAHNLKGDFIESRTLLNLDSEEEGALYVGCSGGRDTLGSLKVGWENSARGAVAMMLQVKGLKGGHSGLEIDKNRGNAIKILNRVLTRLAEGGARLSSIVGGNKRNAIPRECDAVLFIPSSKVPACQKLVVDAAAALRSELSSSDPDLSIVFEKYPKMAKGKVLKIKSQYALTEIIAALPHGVLKMSSDIAGLIETSTNVAVVGTTKTSIEIATSQRSSVLSELQEAVDAVSAILRLGGAKVEHTDGYPGWKPNLDSPVLKLAKQVFTSYFSHEPKVKAIHAGLECGIIGEKFPGIDMLSFGPTLEGVHSPDERIYIDTVERFWGFLLLMLKNIST